MYWINDPRRSAAAGGGQDRAGRLIGTEVVGALDREQFGEPGARAVDAALDGADRAIADGGCLLVGETRRAHQHRRLALVGRQLRERDAEFLELDPALLLRMRFQRFGIAAVRVLDFAPALAIFGAEQVAQDGEEP